MIGKWPSRKRQRFQRPPFSARMQAYLYYARKRRRGGGSDYVPPVAFLHDFVVDSVTAGSYTVSCSSLEAGGDITLAERNVPWEGSVIEQRDIILGNVDDGTVIYRETKSNALENEFTAPVTEGAIPHYCAFVRSIAA